ncbi:nSTAND1 domain-containing NTPase [Actinokineospora iranica]|uniref:WD40 repeat n=1 Tax=Actinokineospora iranica TaxID=1271860 RepID=A0A1G6VAB7_9PSEU|nr:helix-turn-helix domain-containing protein [Actinokineospora iranica]SDD50414.1 WD40 repeat [Actinokineospora iranica]
MDPAPSFGSELRQARTGRGMSLTGLADAVHYSRSYLSKLETGSRAVSVELAQRLDDALGAGGRLVALAEAERRPVCPYRGLAAFGAGDAAWFFGREDAVADLVATAARALANRKPVVVVGPSGVGKSSLVLAGLLPALARDEIPGAAGWPVRVVTPGAAAEPPEPEPGALVVDQFEEIFTLCADEGRRQSFVAALCALARAGTLVVLSLRADFYARCLSYPDLLAGLRDNQVTVGPMTAAQLRAAITGPAEAAGLTLEPGLVELLLADVGASAAGALPLLSHALMVTWHERSDTTLTVAGYRRTGGIENAVASTAEQAYAALDAGQREAARQVLLRLVRVGEHEEDTRRPAPRDALPGRAATAVNELTAARLLTVDAHTVTIAHEALLHAWPRLREWIDADRGGLRVHHQLAEAARAWEAEDRDPTMLYRGPRLVLAADWAAEHGDRLGAAERDFLAASRAVADAAARRERRQTRRLRLLVAGLAVFAVLAVVAGAVAVVRGAESDRQRDLAVSRELALEADQMRLTDPSLATQLSLAAYRVADTPQARGSLLSASGTTYVARSKPHSGSITDLAFTADGKTLVTAGLDGATRFFGVSATGDAVAGAVLRGGAETVTALALDPASGLLATADEVDDTRLWRVGEQPAPLGVVRGTGQGEALALSPGGDLLAVGRADGGVSVWDVGDRARPVARGILPAHSKTVRSLAFSPTAPLLLTGGDDFTSELWDLSGAAPVRLASLATHTATIRAVAFSADGATAAVGSDDHTIDLWSLADPRNPVRTLRLTGHGNAIRGVSFSPDGRMVASASDDQTVRMWNAADGTQLSSMAQPAPARRAAFAADGRLLATGNDLGGLWLWRLPPPVFADRSSATALAYDPGRPHLAVGDEDGTVHLRELGSQRELGALADPGGRVTALAYDPRGGRLVVAGENRPTRVWDVSDPADARPIAAIEGPSAVHAAVFGQGGRVLAVTGTDWKVTLWDTADPARPSRLAVLGGHENAIFGLAFSPDGHLLATGSNDYSGQLWDVSDPRAPRFLTRLADHSNAVSAVAFAPDSRILATASEDHTVHLLDVGDPADPVQVADLTGHSAAVAAVAFSPDGRLLATAGDDGAARVWEVADRARPQPLAVLAGHTGPVRAVGFRPDGGQIATAGSDHTVRLWSTDPDEVADRICALASPPLSPRQWDRHVSGLPFRTLCP